jgi:hypothetical protein
MVCNADLISKNVENNHYATLRDSARERYIGGSACPAITGMENQEQVASIDSFALAGPLVISALLTASGVVMHTYAEYCHKKVVEVVEKAVVKTASCKWRKAGNAGIAAGRFQAAAAVMAENRLPARRLDKMVADVGMGPQTPSTGVVVRGNAESMAASGGQQELNVESNVGPNQAAGAAEEDRVAQESIEELPGEIVAVESTAAEIDDAVFATHK